VGQSALRWDGNVDTQLWFNATRVSVGTVPAGSTWAKNPIPRGPWGWRRSGPAFEPVCEESEACRNAHDEPPPRTDSPCRCSGDSTMPFNLEIVDVIRVPDLPPGAYVLGWRWDCEESDQVGARRVGRTCRLDDGSMRSGKTRNPLMGEGGGAFYICACCHPIAVASADWLLVLVLQLILATPRASRRCGRRAVTSPLRPRGACKPAY